MTGRACATVAPSASVSAEVSSVERMERLRAWLRGKLASFILFSLGGSGRGESDDFPGRRRRRPFETAAVHGDDGEVPGALGERGELVRLRGRARDPDTVIQGLGVATIENAKAREVVEHGPVDLRNRRGPFEAGDAGRGPDHRDRELARRHFVLTIRGRD